MISIPLASLLYSRGWFTNNLCVAQISYINQPLTHLYIYKIEWANPEMISI